MRAILVRDVGILQESCPLTHRLSNVEAVEITDENNIALGKVGIVRTLGQLAAVNAALVKSDPAGQIIPAVRLNFHIENSTLFILQIYIQANAVILITIGKVFLAVKKLNTLNLNSKQRFQKQSANFFRPHNLAEHKIVS